MNKIFQQSVRALKANPVRTGLTTLGIIIGVSTVILVLSAGEGFRGFIAAQVEAYGSNTLFVETRVPPTTKNRGAGPAANDQSRANSPVAITSFKMRDLEDIKRLPNVLNAYGMVAGQKTVSYKDVIKNVIFYGASAARFDIDKAELASGRFYSQSEETGGDQVVILGSSLAEDLFVGEDPVGKLIRIGDLNFQVIGVYKPRGGLGGNENDTLYMPLNTAQKKIMGIDYLLFGVVQVQNTELSEATVEDIRQTMRHNHNIDADKPEKEDFYVQSQAQALDTFNTIFNGITILLIAIAAIALIVGGVGIMNTMYVVVTERTAEIGLKKALGATEKNILQEFLMEAVLVTVLGGVAGIILGAFLGWAVSVVAAFANLEWVFRVPLYSVFLAVGVSALIGIGFGVLPARTAAKLDPVEAMRYE